MLFRPEFVEAILAGRKTVTRRQWKKPRVKVGNVYQARTMMLGKAFARLRVVSLQSESWPMGQRGVRGLLREARLEGFASYPEFYAAYRKINGAQALHEPCWRVAFELEEVRR
jgi:hypothetical protein